MSRYAQIDNFAVVAVRFVESSDPDDLEARVNAAIASLATEVGVNGNLVACNLAGSGDGFNFTVELIAVPTAESTPVGPPVPIEPTSLVARCYMAADDVELPVQRTRALTSITAPIYDEMIAGAAQGLRVMGLVLGLPIIIA